jgi:ATP-dependent DNA helicase RecG
VILYKNRLKDLEKAVLSQNQIKIIKALKLNPYITQKELSKLLGINEKNVRNNMALLKSKDYLRRIGSDRKGYWEILE